MAKRMLSTLSVKDLKKELARRQRGVQALIRRRDRLMAKVHELDATISELGGSSRGSGGTSVGRVRPRNESNLVDALVALLADKTMNVTEITEKVQQAGYQTTAQNFRVIVNQTLINSGKFKRVSRGIYTAK